MAQLGNKLNSYLNGEWATHVKKRMKRITSSIRRMQDKKEIKNGLEE